MNLHAALVAPWYAVRRGTRWIALVLSLLTACGVFSLVHFGMRGAAHAFWAPVAGALASACVFMLTLLVLSPCLLLAIDGRQMRLPRLERDASRAVLLYGLLLVLAPGLLIGSLGGYLWNVLAMLAAAVTAGLAIALLPRIFGFFIWLMPAMFNILQPALQLPRPTQPGFAPFCASLAFCFAALAWMCWRRVLHSEQPYEGTFGSPLMMQLRSMHRGWGSWSNSSMDASTLVRRNPAWLQARVTLSHSGPSHPVTSLRIGLGGLFAPLTVGSRAAQLALVLGTSLLFVLQLGAQAARRHPGHFSESFVHSGLTGMLLWGVGFGGTMLAILPISQLTQRWMKQNAELPLLALMPGLGDAERVKRRLLSASLLPPLAAQGALMLLTTMMAILLHSSLLSTFALLLTLAGSMIFLTAFIMSVLGGKPLGRWPSVGLCLFGYLLFSVSIVLPVMGSGDHIFRYVIAFLVAWAVLLAILAWLALRGWRGLVRRPHPFIANAL